MACPITYGGHNNNSAVAQMGDRLATINMGRKLGAVPPFLAGGLGLNHVVF